MFKFYEIVRITFTNKYDVEMAKLIASIAVKYRK